MDNGWVKLWEETIYHPIWRNDPTAWKIFEYLLISSYRGSPQGTTVKTLQQITDVCSGKNGTNFKAIKRLERNGMVETKSTNRYTVYKICNWWQYQGKTGFGKNQVKTKSKPSNTLIRIKNKEYITTGISEGFEKAVSEFFEHRRVLKKPMTDRAKELFVKKLQDEFHDEASRIQAIETAIERGWLTVYPSKDESMPKASYNEKTRLKLERLREARV